MAQLMSREVVADIYDRVAAPERLLYHVAHARKENSDREYDGDDLIKISARRAERDITKLRAASQNFRGQSMEKVEVEAQPEPSVLNVT